MKRTLAGAALAVLVGAPFPAHANGRFPRAQRLVEDPGDANHLLLAATFGLVTTTDRGQNWYEDCEASFAGDDTYSGDPILERVAGGALVVDVQSEINRSADGCGWVPTLGSSQTAATETFEDFAVDHTGTTIVALATHLASGVTTIHVEQSTDAGATWAQVGTAVPASLVYTIDLDPTDTSHLFVTGLSPADGSGVLLSSNDTGTTWSSSPIPNTSSSEPPYIAAIDPSDAKKIYVRTDSWILPDGAPELVANDALLYSSDGGSTWSELLRKSAKLLGFALSPDGSSVLAGYGDPVEAGHDVDPDDTGIYQASTSDFQFDSVFSLDAQGNNANITCLTWTALGTYACLESAVDGTYEELAFFPGGPSSFDGGAPLALMHLNDIKGPPPCCGATDALCAWPDVCTSYPFFACEADAQAPPGCSAPSDAGPLEAGTPSAQADGSVASVTGSSGSSGGDASMQSFVSDASPSAIGTPHNGGCSCRAAAPAPEGAPLRVLVATSCMLFLLRKRRSHVTHRCIGRRIVRGWIR
jgi:hypothetical protein